MIFTVEIDLTDKGVSNWTQVARTVFRYLEMLRQYQGGLPAYLHEERKQIAQMSFQFMQEKDRGQYTRAVFKNVQNIGKDVQELFVLHSEIPSFNLCKRLKVFALPVAEQFCVIAGSV